MNIRGNKGKPLLLLGDLFLLFAGLWLSLLARYHTMPDVATFLTHAGHFSALFIVWFVVFYGAGLYDRFAFDYEKRLPGLLLKAQFFNAFISVLYFYLLSDSIAPKTILFIFLIISSALVLAWRLFGFSLVHSPRRIRTAIIGSGGAFNEMVSELSATKRYGMNVVRAYDLKKESGDFTSLKNELEQAAVEQIIIDYLDPKSKEAMNSLYFLIFTGVKFARFDSVYESLFSRISLEQVNSEWFLLNIYAKNQRTYQFAKRLMDCVLAFVMLVVTAPFFPLIALCIKLESKGDAFIIQERIGRDGKIIHIPKFRTMTTNDQGVWLSEADNRVTKVGYFLRKSRIDELPQLWSVLKGDISLVGPRPDIIGLGRELEKSIPYYNSRNLVAPGLSGWAQISQDKPPQSVEETRLRLSYDLYYVKHRSLTLDLEIALKTVRILLSRLGM